MCEARIPNVILPTLSLGSRFRPCGSRQSICSNVFFNARASAMVLAVPKSSLPRDHIPTAVPEVALRADTARSQFSNSWMLRVCIAGLLFRQ